MQRGRELGHARRQQHDDGGAVVETGHLREAFQPDALAAPVLADRTVGVGGDFHAAPHGFHAGHQHGADHHLHHRAEIGVEMAHQPFVAGEQARHVAHRVRADAEQPAGHVHGFAQGAGPRHVHAVVVARGQVDGGEQAVGEGPRVGRAGQQFGGGERLPLGLENPPLLDLAQLADAAIGGHQQGTRVGIGHACTGLERAGEEGVEAGVGARVGFGGFGQVHAEAGDHGVDQALLDGRMGRIGQLARQCGQQAVRQDAGQGGGEAHGTGALVSRVMSSAMAAGSNGGRISPASRPSGSSTAMAAECSTT